MSMILYQHVPEWSLISSLIYLNCESNDMKFTIKNASFPIATGSWTPVLINTSNLECKSICSSTCKIEEVLLDNKLGFDEKLFLSYIHKIENILYQYLEIQDDYISQNVRRLPWYGVRQVAIIYFNILRSCNINTLMGIVQEETITSLLEKLKASYREISISIDTDNTIPSGGDIVLFGHTAKALSIHKDITNILIELQPLMQHFQMVSTWLLNNINTEQKKIAVNIFLKNDIIIKFIKDNDTNHPLYNLIYQLSQKCVNIDNCCNTSSSSSSSSSVGDDVEINDNSTSIIKSINFNHKKVLPVSTVDNHIIGIAGSVLIIAASSCFIAYIMKRK